jgi:hypothetical protein
MPSGPGSPRVPLAGKVKRRGLKECPVGAFSRLSHCCPRCSLASSASLWTICALQSNSIVCHGGRQNSSACRRSDSSTPVEYEAHYVPQLSLGLATFGATTAPTNPARHLTPFPPSLPTSPVPQQRPLHTPHHTAHHTPHHTSHHTVRTLSVRVGVRDVCWAAEQELQKLQARLYSEVQSFTASVSSGGSRQCGRSCHSGRVSQLAEENPRCRCCLHVLRRGRVSGDRGR